mgnify:CR=1 FL=1
MATVWVGVSEEIETELNRSNMIKLVIFDDVEMVGMVIFEHGKLNDTIERKIGPRFSLEY